MSIIQKRRTRGGQKYRNSKIKGEFLFFLDSDDRIEMNAIHLLVDNQERT
jgi:hypothetical protein